MSKTAYLIGITRYQRKTVFWIVRHFTVYFTRQEGDLCPIWLDIQTLRWKKYLGVETWASSIVLVIKKGTLSLKRSHFAFSAFELGIGLELPGQEKRWICRVQSTDILFQQNGRVQSDMCAPQHTKTASSARRAITRSPKAPGESKRSPNRTVRIK